MGYNRWKLFFLLFGFFLLIWFLVGLLGTLYAIRGQAVAFPEKNVFLGQLVESVQFSSLDGISISAWWINESSSNDTAIVILVKSFLDEL